MRFLEGLKDRFFGIPGCDADTHAVFREQPGATRADARAAADNECNVLYGKLGVAFGLCHVASSDAFGSRQVFGISLDPDPARDQVDRELTAFSSLTKIMGIHR